MKFAFILFTLCSFLAFAADEMRCEGKGLPQERCNLLRDMALKSGCIDQGKYDELINQNRCPSCNQFNDYMGSCPPGCFAKGTKILVGLDVQQSPFWERVEVIVQNPSKYLVWGMDQSSGIKNPKLKPFKIRNVVYGPEEFPLIEIVTQLGSKIRLTTEHAVLLNSGVMVAAKHLSIGDAITSASGNSDRIVKINHIPTDEEVFNVLLDVNATISHTLIAENLIVGDQYWQGVLTPMLNQTIIND